MKGLKRESYKEQLRILRLLCQEKNRLGENLTALHSSLKGDCGKVGVGLSFPGNKRQDKRNQPQLASGEFQV